MGILIVSSLEILQIMMLQKFLYMLFDAHVYVFLE